MPLFAKWEIGEYGHAAIWKIEEPESFFGEYAVVSGPEIKNEKKRIEHLAGRFLLKFLDKDFPLHSISKDEHDKPRIPGDKQFFSISHSWPYVAVSINSFLETGIDIQTWHPRIEQIQHKFLSPEEQPLFNYDTRLLTLAWCAKEAVYKWNGKRGVDFIKHLPIISYDKEDGHIPIFFNMDKIPRIALTTSLITTDFALSFISSVIYLVDSKYKYN